MREQSTMSRPDHSLLICAVALLHAAILVRCSSPKTESTAVTASRTTATTPEDKAAGIAAWNVVYGVLQHPRCMNCHPLHDAPLQGDGSVTHLQNVQRGEDGHGLFAMHCDACHQTENLPGAHLPPGAPKWHLPAKDMPLVFEGRSSSELCRQLRDPAHNGGKTPEELYDHVAHDPLVGWGWSPGEGRTPVPIPREQVARAMRTWIDNGCACP